MLKRCALIPFMILLLAAMAASSAGVPTQKLDVTYDPETRLIYGTLDVMLPDAPETAYFMLLPNLSRIPNPYLSKRLLDNQYPVGFEPADLAIDAVVQSPSGTSLSYRLLSLPPTLQTYSLEETVLAVDLRDAGPSPTIQVRFATTAPRVAFGDDGVTEDILTWRFGWYPLLIEDTETIEERNGAIALADSHSFPFVLPWTEMEAVVHAPADLVFLSGADHIETDAPSDESEGQASHSTRFEGPTRSFAIVLGDGYSRFELDGPTPIEVAYRAGHEDDARLIATYARDILDDYTETFGAYPRERLTIVEGTNRAGTSFAADGILWISSLFFTHNDILLPGILNRYLEFVLAHEIAHQWFGIGTGVDLDRNSWLSEGLSQYASISYFEGRHGTTDGNLFQVVAEGLLEDLVDRQFGFYNLREHQVELPHLLTLWSDFDEAIVKPSVDVEYSNADVSRLYNKGYLIARMIASVVGKDAFDRALRASFETYRGDRLDPETLQSLVEAEAGYALDELFDAWVFGDVSADYSLQILERRPASVGFETIVRVSRIGGIPQPVEVEATLTSGATTRQTWDGAEAEGTLVFNTPSPVQRMTIDPDHRIPDGNRLNNNDPVKIVSAVNRAAMPLDAYVLTPDPSTGGFTFGWLDRFRISLRDTMASLVVNEGRHHSMGGTVDIANDRLTGNLTYSYTTYDQRMTGSPARYWESDVRLSVGLHRTASASGPFWSLRLSALDLPSIATSAIRSVVLDIAPDGATRLALSVFDEIRLVPHLFIQGVGTLGSSVGDLPDPLRFEFNELHSFELSPRRNKLSGRIAIDLLTQAEPYNVLNLAMLDGNRTRLYVAGGLGWTSLQDCCTTSPSAEIGIEQVLELSTLGGLIPFNVRLGVATPVTEGGKTVFYFGVSL